MATFEQFTKSFPDGSYAKGKKFEDFLCEFLQNQHPLYSNIFERVWPFRKFPKRWHNKPDLGTDLVAEDREGRICAIQVKFFGKEYTIPKGEVDSFLTDSNVKIVDYRLLIASTDKIGLNATIAIETQEKPVQTFLLSDLEKWTGWPRSINSAAPKTKSKPKKPRDYQRAAIKAVVEGLDARGQLIMACGTGKTLTSQRIAEGLESKKTLVLVPSLLLLAQTLDDWVANGEVDFDFLAVCSDSTVTRRAEDRIEFQTSDCGFLVAKTGDEIVFFLSKRSKKAKVIFSTYASCPKVANAIRQKGSSSFDLLIADEAHQCAGKVSDDYQTALSEERLPARKRLFMTATPRVFSAGIKKSAAERGVEIVSMDDESVFGPVLHKLSFGQAIKHNPPILTDYQVVIVGVTSDDVKKAIKKRELVLTESGFCGDAAQLAAMVGLSMAMKKYGLRRTISFHSRVSRARDFAKEFAKLLLLLKGSRKVPGLVNTQYVSGEMSTHIRNERLRQLANVGDNESYLLCNARCLAEGVDVEAIDSVVFSDPKSSTIEIIQAVGRAIRLSANKKIGTIVIPVFVANADNAEFELSSSNYKNVWGIINALRSHDEVLGEELDAMRNHLGQGRQVSFDGSKIIINLPKTVGNEFFKSFRTRLVEFTTEAWNWYYGLLKVFVKKNGHALVEHSYVTECSHKLGYWCVEQRYNHKSGKLSATRIRKLENFLQYGWEWDSKVNVIRKYIQKVECYYDKNGHSLMKRNDRDIQASMSLKKLYVQKKLPEKYIRILEQKLDFIWYIDKYFWLQDYRALRRWVGKHKRCPPKKTIYDCKISKNITTKRDIGGFRQILVHQYRFWTLKKGKGHKRNGPPPRKLTDKELRAIERIPYWTWDAYGERWMQKFRLLLQFYNREGHPHVPPAKYYEPDGKGDPHDLSRWLFKQRKAYSQNTIRSDRFKLINDIPGFDWSGQKGNILERTRQKHDKHFEILKSYINEHGHACPGGRHEYMGVRLGQIISKWRITFNQFGVIRHRPLSNEQIIELENIHPSWMWSAEPEGACIPLTLSDANRLIEGTINQELRKARILGFLAGLRYLDLEEISWVSVYGIRCIKVNARTGANYRIIPCHEKLPKNIKLDGLNKRRMGSLHRNCQILQSFKNPLKTQFTCFHLTFRSELKKIGLNREVLNNLSGWGPKFKLNEDQILQASRAIDKIPFNY